MIYETFREAFQNIWGNKFRTFLTMLGIIIGVMAVMVIVGLGNGMTKSMQDEFADMGTNTLSVQVMGYGARSVKIDDFYAIVEAHPDIFSAVSPTSSLSGSVKVGTETDAYSSTSVKGVSEAYLDMAGDRLATGRALNYVDMADNKKVCLVGDYISRVGYGGNAVGQSIKIGSEKYTIVGVLQDDDNNLTRAFTSGSMVAYLSYQSLLRLSATVSDEITSFYVSAPQGGTMEAAETAMTAILMERFDEDEDAFSVSSQNALEDTMSSVTSMLTVMLGGIAAISLVVGGIGIMNIMMVTVTERTREIGIRKAIGASRGVILKQFLMEAVVLCMMGCCLGISLSWAVLQIVNTVVVSLDMTFSLNMTVVMIAVVFCFLIGIVFGLYPANKAAKMKPIDALHYGG